MTDAFVQAWNGGVVDLMIGIPASLDMTPYVYVENDRVLALPTAESEFMPRKAWWKRVSERRSWATKSWTVPGLRRQSSLRMTPMSFPWIRTSS